VFAFFLKTFIRNFCKSLEFLKKKVLALNLLKYFDLLPILEQKNKVEVYSALFTFINFWKCRRSQKAFQWMVEYYQQTVFQLKLRQSTSQYVQTQSWNGFRKLFEVSEWEGVVPTRKSLQTNRNNGGHATSEFRFNKFDHLNSSCHRYCYYCSCVFILLCYFRKFQVVQEDIGHYNTSWTYQEYWFLQKNKAIAFWSSISGFSLIGTKSSDVGLLLF